MVYSVSVSDRKDQTGFVISIDMRKNAFLKVTDLQRSTCFAIFAGTRNSLHSCPDFIEIMCMIKNSLGVRGTKLGVMPEKLAPQ